MNAQSSQRAEINRANAQHSTGPKTAEGKSHSSLNAVKTGLTGRTVLLPSDDAESYRNHVSGYFAELSPVGCLESELVQSLADNAWRLDRIIRLELNIYAMGGTQFAAEVEDQASDQQSALLELKTFQHYEKQLRNLQIQESRLRRAKEKDMAALKQLQQARLAEAAELYLIAKADGQSFNSAEYGFDFQFSKSSILSKPAKCKSPQKRRNAIPLWPPLRDNHRLQSCHSQLKSLAYAEDRRCLSHS